MWEAELADVNPYQAEDEDFELTEEEAEWGEDLAFEREGEEVEESRGRRP